MIITCPSCSTRYKLDPSRFGPEGRRVRCTSCSHVWTELPPDDLPKPVAGDPDSLGSDVVAQDPRELEAAPAFMTAGAYRDTGDVDDRRGRRDSLAADTRRPRRRRGGAGWLVLILIVGALGAAGVLARETVVRAWPPAERLYEAVGLKAPLPGEGLSIKVTEHRRDAEGQKAVLIVKGEVTNTSEDVRDVPQLKASLRNGNGAEIKTWTFATSQARLLPGESAPFVTRIEDPSTEATALNINFVTGNR